MLYVSADYHMKAWNDAIYRMYQKAPSSYRVDQLSAEVFETQGKYTEAVAEYRKAIEKNPKAINLHYRLGRALLQQSHDPAVLDQARKEFEAELALNPSDAVAEYQVAQILAAEQKKAAQPRRISSEPWNCAPTFRKRSSRWRNCGWRPGVIRRRSRCWSAR